MKKPGILARARVAWHVMRAETSPSARAPWDDWWYSAAGAAASRSAAGMNVTPETALTIGAVFRAVRLLSDDVAQLPLHLFESLPDHPDGSAGGKRRLRNDLAYVLGKRPNARQTSFEFRQMLSSGLLLRGNGYARIVSGARGYVTELIPMSPTRVRVAFADSGRKVFLHTDRKGTETRLDQDQVFHLCGFQVDPENPEGMGPVTLARTSLGLSLATEEFGARQFSQTPKPAYVLEHPLKLDEEVSKRIAASFRDAHSGPGGWGGVPVIEEGMKVANVGMSHDDAQFLETRQFQVTDVARWFGVPPHMIGDLSKSSFSNIEQQSIDYVVHSLMPWLVLWEQSIERDLIVDESFAEFKLDALLRGEALPRAQAQQLRVNMRALTPNEVRAQENMNPVSWGDEPAMPQGAPAPPSAAQPRDGNAPQPGAGANRVAPHLNGSHA